MPNRYSEAINEALADSNSGSFLTDIREATEGREVFPFSGNDVYYGISEILDCWDVKTLYICFLMEVDDETLDAILQEVGHMNEAKLPFHPVEGDKYILTLDKLEGYGMCDIWGTGLEAGNRYAAEWLPPRGLSADDKGAWEIGLWHIHPDDVTILWRAPVGPENSRRYLVRIKKLEGYSMDTVRNCSLEVGKQYEAQYVDTGKGTPHYYIRDAKPCILWCIHPDDVEILKAY